MSTTELVVLIVAVVVALAVAAFLIARAQKRNRLRERFGPEYDRTVERSDKRSAAERELKERAERREALDISPLPENDRRRFAARWREVQEDFVDRPALAVRQADLLVQEVMGRRGYPTGDFDQQARDVSVDHANVVEEYRQAHEISELNDRDRATTEQLRQAMVHYRALFTDLLDSGDDGEDDGHSRRTRSSQPDHYDDPDGGYHDSYDRPSDRHGLREARRQD